MIRPRLRRTPAVVVLGWLAASAAPAEPVESSIDRVTIYPNQLARVERVAEVSPASARGTLAFADLPGRPLASRRGSGNASCASRSASCATSAKPPGIGRRPPGLRSASSTASPSCPKARMPPRPWRGRMPPLAGKSFGSASAPARAQPASGFAARSGRSSDSTTRSKRCKSASTNWGSRGPSASPSAPITAEPKVRCGCA